jgi:hypothetical protein
MWSRVTWFIRTDVSEDRATQIFTVLDLTCRKTDRACKSESGDSAVGMLIEQRAGRQQSQLNRIFLLENVQICSGAHTAHVPGFSPKGKVVRSLQLSTVLHLVFMLIITIVKPSLPSLSARGAHGIFTFTSTRNVVTYIPRCHILEQSRVSFFSIL